YSSVSDRPNTARIRVPPSFAVSGHRLGRSHSLCSHRLRRAAPCSPAEADRRGWPLSAAYSGGRRLELAEATTRPVGDDLGENRRAAVSNEEASYRLRLAEGFLGEARHNRQYQLW